MLSEQSYKQHSPRPCLAFQLLPLYQDILEADVVVGLKVMHQVGSGVTYCRFGRAREVLCTQRFMSIYGKNHYSIVK